jgi:hypothetical protein
MKLHCALLAMLTSISAFTFSTEYYVINGVEEDCDISYDHVFSLDDDAGFSGNGTLFTFGDVLIINSSFDFPGKEVIVGECKKYKNMLKKAKKWLRCSNDGSQVIMYANEE